MPCILITGANRGIGFGLVRQYRQMNWQVIATCRHPESATELSKFAADHAEHVTVLPLDVQNESAINNFTELCTRPIDILLNNAGVWEPQAAGFGKTTASQWLDILKTNTVAPFLLIQALYKNIAQSDLKIIANMSSGLASIEQNTMGGNCLYRSSKAALNMITKTLAADLRRHGITVVALSPGWVKTDMGGTSAPLTIEESVKGLRQALSTLTIKNTGEFISYDGSRIPW